MPEITGYEYTDTTSTLVAQSELDAFLAENDVISYELYEGDDETEPEG